MKWLEEAACMTCGQAARLCSKVFLVRSEPCKNRTLLALAYDKHINLNLVYLKSADAVAIWQCRPRQPKKRESRTRATAIGSRPNCLFCCFMLPLVVVHHHKNGCKECSHADVFVLLSRFNLQPQQISDLCELSLGLIFFMEL